VRDIVGLYLTPRRRRRCCASMRSRRSRRWTAPLPLPLLPGVPERRTHDYRRYGTPNLYAAVNLASGHVIADLTPRHRAAELIKFLLIDREVPEGLQVHIVIDNSCTHKTPAVKRWLLGHPPFVRTSRRPTVPGSTWRNVGSANSGVNGSDAAPTVPSRSSWPPSVPGSPSGTTTPRPYVWHKTADEILESLAAYCWRINDSGH
jgi:hypothetical protein